MTEKKQTIFRAAHGKENPYFQMLRTTAQDESLSFESRGVIAYLLSKPNYWEISKQNLMNEGGMGRTKMDRIMGELTTAGYLAYTQEQGDGGKFSRAVYTLSEEPQPVAQNALADDDEPIARNVLPVEGSEPVARKPRADNEHQDNKESLDSTESKTLDKKEKIIAATPPVAPPQAPPTIHGYSSGDLIWVWSDKKREHVQCVVTRETEAFVWFRCSGIEKELHRAPKNIYREKPAFLTFEELNADQQVVAKWCRKVKAGEGIPGATLTYVNTVLKQLRIRFGEKAPKPDELERVFAWNAGQGNYTYADPDKIPGLVNDYRDEHKPQTAIKAPAPHEVADPNCALCKGIGRVKVEGALVPCDCTVPKAVAL